MDATELHMQIRQFVVDSLGMPDLQDGDDIFELGRATSLFSVQLLMYIEEELGIPLEDDDLQRENFCTIDGMSKMIARKLESS